MNVYDIKTGNALFGEGIRHRLQEGVKPYLKDEDASEKAVDTVEHVLCTALVSVAVSLAVRLATKLAEKLTQQKPPA